MNRPQLSSEEALKLIPADVKEQVKLLGIRGYYKKTMGNPLQNDRGIYDDAIFLISHRYFNAYNANTDPSVTRKGIAVLKPGVHYYKKGKHGISKPGGGYPALRPDTPGEKLPVIRDGTGESMGIAINIHKGGYKTTSSEGCQTIYPDQWTSFISLVYDQMELFGQPRIPYILIEY